MIFSFFRKLWTIEFFCCHQPLIISLYNQIPTCNAYLHSLFYHLSLDLMLYEERCTFQFWMNLIWFPVHSQFTFYYIYLFLEQCIAFVLSIIFLYNSIKLNTKLISSIFSSVSQYNSFLILTGWFNFFYFSCIFNNNKTNS